MRTKTKTRNYLIINKKSKSLNRIKYDRNSIVYEQNKEKYNYLAANNFNRYIKKVINNIFERDLGVNKEVIFINSLKGINPLYLVELLSLTTIYSKLQVIIKIKDKKELELLYSEKDLNSIFYKNEHGLFKKIII